ncbi:MAG: 30S ribosomal protein S12 methylthiotransferase RimO [Alphaproteobacteria bacterium]|uniref:Ribosomal protein uS12 methylthiotransferase RimO n=1 Tax=Candidatus Nitrobium versatile TaxID=2884831 RepID=A0A953J561_9BACT|nr:30S ribosomal protein S12 methylthiotransferase RimO [Candidatus Nitrobium versatile]
MKIHITTLGCPKNTVDSGHLARRFAAEGFIPVEESGEADILLVNTCGFVRDAKEESVDEILRLAEIKKKQEGGGTKSLLVFGCLAKRYGAELVQEIPEIDGLWGVSEEERIVEYCKGLKTRKGAEAGAKKGGKTAAYAMVSAAEPGLMTSYAYLKVAEGCDKKCTFCVIPSIRGRFRSVPREEVLREAEDLIRSGVRELILVAQDITSYGKETAGSTLAALLREMVALPGDFFIRLLYLYPTEITDELLEVIAAEDKIQKYIDIPLQHSEDRILRLMGRRGTRKEYLRLLRNIRRRIPSIILRTTFIVGFPSETEEDFHGLVDFIEEVRFDRLGVFKFSREEGTPSAMLKGQVPERVKERRYDEIMGRQALISLERNREFVGKRLPAIIDEVDADVVIARFYSHAPEIDGAVIVEKDGMPEAGSLSGPLQAGDIVMVEVVDAYDYDVKGKIVGPVAY